LIEALIQSDFQGVVDYFRNSSDPLIELEMNSNKSVSAKATQVVVALGLKSAPVKESTPPVQESSPLTAAPVSRTQPIEPDLINFNESVPVRPSPAPVASSVVPDLLSNDVDATRSLFDSLSVKQASPPQTVPASNGHASTPVQASAFDLIDKPRSASSKQPSNNNILSGLDPVDDLLKPPAPQAGPQPMFQLPSTMYGMNPMATSGQPGFMGAPQGFGMSPQFMNPMFPMYSMSMPPNASGPMHPMSGFMPPSNNLDFKVQARGPPRRVIDTDLLPAKPSNAPSSSNSNGFEFIGKQDAFDFVQHELKQNLG